MTHRRSKNHCQCQNKRPIRPVVTRYGSGLDTFFASDITLDRIPPRQRVGAAVLRIAPSLTALSQIGSQLNAAISYPVVPSVVG